MNTKENETHIEPETEIDNSSSCSAEKLAALQSMLQTKNLELIFQQLEIIRLYSKYCVYMFISQLITLGVIIGGIAAILDK